MPWFPMNLAMTIDSQSALHLLLITDEPGKQAAYRILLEGLSRPVNVLVATPGEEALKRLKEEKPDCIFVESGNCRICGDSRFIADLKASRNKIGAPIMFLSGGTPSRECTGKTPGTYCTPTRDLHAEGFQRALEYAMEHHRMLAQVSTAREAEKNKSAQLRKLVKQLQITQNELQVEHRVHQELLASLTSILIGLDGENLIGFWNRIAEETFGLAAHDVLGKPLHEIGIIWKWDSIAKGLARCRKTHTTIRLQDIRYRLRAGRTGLLGFTVNWLNTHRDDNQELLLLGADITERRAMEAKQQRTLKLESVGRLAAGIAHELNTPIQYLGDTARFLRSAFSDAWELLDKITPLASESNPLCQSLPRSLVQDLRKTIQEADLNYLGEEIPKAIDQAISGIDQMAKIVSAMRDFSHPGEAKTKVNINQTIENTLIVGRGQWKHIAEIESYLAPDLPELFIVANDIQQVLLNLLVNAAQAIDDARGEGSSQMGQITISTLLRDQWVEINITDTGMGIPDEIKNKVFDPFFTTKEIGKGTGQGLSITHDIIVKKHAGKISFESVAGQGTRFQIHLPVENIANAERE